MSLTLSTVGKKQSRLKGYKPRIGISVATMDKHFAVGDTFASNTQKFDGIIKANPRAKYSSDRLGGIARNGTLSWDVLNQELFSNIFNTYSDPENNVVTGYLYWDVADVAKNSLLLASASSQHVTLGSHSSIQPALPISVEAWVMFPSTGIGSTVYLFANDDQANYSGIWFYKSPADKIFIHYGDNTGAGAGDRRSKLGATALVADRWYHIVVVVQAAANMQIYINGADDNGAYSGAGGAMAYGTSLVATIGKRNTVYSDSYIAQVGFWDVALSAADALSLYGSGTPKDLNAAASYDTDRTGDLQAYWNFNDRILGAAPSPTTLEDVSDVGISNDGTIVNTPLWSHQIPICLDADRLQFYKGLIKDFPSINYDKVSFKSTGQEPFKDVIVGNIVDGTELSTVITDFNDKAIGKPKPTVYGNHRTFYGSWAGDFATNDRKMNPSKMLYLGADDTYYYMMVASHAIDIYADMEAQWGAIWVYDETLGRYVYLIATFTVHINDDTDGCIIKLTKATVFTTKLVDIWYGDSTNSNDNSVNITWDNPTNGNDEDFSNYTSADMPTDSKTGDKAEIDLDFSGYSNGNTISNVNIIARTEITDLTSQADFQFKVHTADVEAEVPEVMRGVGAGAASVAGVNASITINFEKLNNNVMTASQARVYEVYKEIHYANSGLQDESLLDNMYFAGTGRRYGTWINGRATGDGYTETHVDDDKVADYIKVSAADGVSGGVVFDRKFASATGDFINNGVLAGDILIIDDAVEGKLMLMVVKVVDATNLYYIGYFSAVYMGVGTANVDYEIWDSRMIENAAGVAESFLRDEFGLGNSDINRDSFNIASNDLNTSVISFGISVHSDNMTKFIYDYLQSIKSIIFQDADNEVKIRTFVLTDPFTASGDSVPNNQDIFEFDPQTTFKIVAGENDKIDISGAGAGLFAITLTAAEYTGTTLAAHIQTKMDTAFGAAEITCTYSAATGKFTFTEVLSGDTWTFKWADGANKATSVGRFIGFDISANDTLAAAGTLVSDYPLWADSFVENPIIDKSFSCDKTADKIKTTVEVEYFYNEATGQFLQVVTDTDVSFHAETKEKLAAHDYTKDQTTAEILLYFLSKNADHTGRLSRKYWECKFKTWLNGCGVELWDFINVRHPVINGLLGSATELTQKWLVVDIQYDLKRDEIEITAVEI